MAARRQSLLAYSNFLVVFLPGLPISLGVGECLADHIFNAHARCRIPGRHIRRADALPGGIAGALGILAERKFDARHGAFEEHVVRILAPAQLNDTALATDRICAAV